MTYVSKRPLWLGGWEWKQHHELEKNSYDIITQGSQDQGSDQIITMKWVRIDQILDIHSEHRETGLAGSVCDREGNPR